MTCSFKTTVLLYAIMASLVSNSLLLAAKKKDQKASTAKKKKSKKVFREMSYEDFKENKNSNVAKKNYELAIKYLEKMLPLCSDLNELHDLMLELADLLMETRDLDRASKMYNEFINLYPGSSKIEYAYYKAIQCNFAQIADIDRDQSKTQETLELAQTFLDRAFTLYAAEVKEIYNKCQHHLLASEMNVVSFYIHRNSIHAAQKRLDLIRSTYMPILAKAEAPILIAEYELAHHQNNTELAAQKKQELSHKFPEFSQLLAENNKQNLRAFVSRF